MRIARVFPRRTKATPKDELAFVGPPPLLCMPEIDEVHISVAFTWDLKYAETLARAWELVGVPVKLGGPAYKKPGGEFVPGLYLEKGYVITSRGCDRHCWFCGVPEREGGVVRELPIAEGHNVLDDNLLACSQGHILGVFKMLAEQSRRPEFTGGLEAARLKPWHVELLRNVKARRIYMAYDTPDDLEPLRVAGRMLTDAGFTRAAHRLGCYCLIGYRGDTFELAEKRLRETWDAGFVPYAMLYKGESGETDISWRRFQREWLRPQIVAAKMGG
jgi:hypothetical protein